MYKIPFQLLCNHIRTIEDIKAVQSYRGQELQEGSLTCEPTVTIRFLPADTNTIGNYIEEVDQQIEIKIITSFTGENDRQFSPPAGHPDHDKVIDAINNKFKENYFRLSDLPEYSALEGEPDDLDIMGTLHRKRVAFQQPVGKKLVSTIIYECLLYDYAAETQFSQITAGFEILEYSFEIET